MAFFQRKPQTSDPANFYMVGLDKPVMLVGLGNPGAEYKHNRHNVGFNALEAFIDVNDEFSSWVNKTNLKAEVSTGKVGRTRVIAIKPTTFMNLSGEAVQLVSNFYKVPLDSIAVIYDDIDVDFGNIRLRHGGGSAGHNGIKSITKLLGSNEYGRVRIGIGPKSPEQIKSEDFVLQDFNAEESALLPNMTREVNAILGEYIYGQQQLPQDTRSFLI